VVAVLHQTGQIKKKKSKKLY